AAAGCAPVRASRAVAVALHPHRPHLGMARAIVVAQIRVAHPHQATFGGTVLLTHQPLAEPLHHARDERAPVAVASDVVLLLVLLPEPLGSRLQEAVHVTRD